MSLLTYRPAGWHLQLPFPRCYALGHCCRHRCPACRGCCPCLGLLPCRHTSLCSAKLPFAGSGGDGQGLIPATEPASGGGGAGAGERAGSTQI